MFACFSEEDLYVHKDGEGVGQSSPLQRTCKLPFWIFYNRKAQDAKIHAKPLSCAGGSNEVVQSNDENSSLNSNVGREGSSRWAIPTGRNRVSKVKRLESTRTPTGFLQERNSNTDTLSDTNTNNRFPTKKSGSRKRPFY